MIKTFGYFNNYFQVGRAGRDKLVSKCILFFSPSDSSIHRFHMMDIGTEELRQHRTDLLLQFEHFLAFTEKCRRLAVLNHLEPASSGASLGLSRAKQCCDNCTRHLLKGGKVGDSLDVETEDDKEVEVGGEASLLMVAVKLLGDKTALGVSVNLVRGLKDAQLGEKHTESSVFGKGNMFSSRFWFSLGRELMSVGLLKEVRFWGAERGDEGGLGVRVTKKGEEFLKGKEPLFLPLIGQLKTLNGVPTEEQEQENGKLAKPDNGLMARPALYWKLVSARKALAKKVSIYPHMVVEERVLLQMATKKPNNLNLVANIPGFSQAKIKLYGEHFVTVIKQHLDAESETIVSQSLPMITNEHISGMNSEPILQKSGAKRNPEKLPPAVALSNSTPRLCIPALPASTQSQVPAKRIRVTAPLRVLPKVSIKPNNPSLQVIVQNHPDAGNNNAFFKTLSDSAPVSTLAQKSRFQSATPSTSNDKLQKTLPKLQSLPLMASLNSKSMPEWFHKPELKREIMKMKFKSNSLFK